MANPVIVETTLNAWTKVATNVRVGFIWIKDSTKTYLHTYRATGGAAPTDQGEGIEMCIPGREINSQVAIDVYIYTTGDDNGKVRVDV